MRFVIPRYWTGNTRVLYEVSGFQFGIPLKKSLLYEYLGNPFISSSRTLNLSSKLLLDAKLLLITLPYQLSIFFATSNLIGKSTMPFPLLTNRCSFFSIVKFKN